MPIYMKYEGIDGDIETGDHEKWIELKSFQFGVGRSITNPTGKGGNRTAGAPSVSEISVTKVTDNASIKLLEASLTGTGKVVQIDFCTEPKLPPYLTVTLENTLVSSFSPSSGGDRPSESITLNFTKFEYKHTPLDKDNEPGSPSVKSWDLSTQTIG